MILRANFWSAVIVFAAAMSLSGTAATAQDEAAPSDGDTQIVSFTAEQAARGEREYVRSCLDCHGANLNDGEFGGPPLTGYYFREKWFEIGVAGLLGYTASAMPPDRPGALSEQTYVDLVAYILSKNEIEPGDTALPADLSVLDQLALPEIDTP